MQLLIIALSMVCVVLVEGCTEQCLFHYDVTFNEAQSRCGQFAIGDVSLQNNRAVFSGDGFISLPVFERNTLQPYFAIALKVKYTGKTIITKQPMAILSNGCGMTKPTIELSFSRDRVNLRMVLTVDGMKTEDVIISVPDVNLAKETMIKIGQDSKRIQLKVGDKSIHVMEKSIYEHIGSSECPLQIGSGFGLVPFTGEVDEFVFYPCINDGFFEKNMFP